MNVPSQRFKSVFVPFIVFVTIQGCSLAPYREHSGESINRVPIIPKKPEAAEKKGSDSVQVGLASWYTTNSRGKKTATGEVYDPHRRTAAHRSFPLGSRVRVTRLDNGKSIEVQINDRGPFVAGRVIDLSRAAADALGISEKGIVTVRVELLDSTFAK
jgi:rare lipoprotein A (peptidoglycan hydrolase)